MAFEYIVEHGVIEYIVEHCVKIGEMGGQVTNTMHVVIFQQFWHLFMLIHA